jgi:hypothetical protein
MSVPSAVDGFSNEEGPSNCSDATFQFLASAPKGDLVTRRTA